MSGRKLVKLTHCVYNSYLLATRIQILASFLVHIFHGQRHFASSDTQNLNLHFLSSRDNFLNRIHSALSSKLGNMNQTFHFTSKTFKGYKASKASDVLNFSIVNMSNFWIGLDGILTLMAIMIAISISITIAISIAISISVSISFMRSVSASLSISISVSRSVSFTRSVSFLAAIFSTIVAISGSRS